MLTYADVCLLEAGGRVVPLDCLLNVMLVVKVLTHNPDLLLAAAEPSTQLTPAAPPPPNPHPHTHALPTHSTLPTPSPTSPRRISGGFRAVGGVVWAQEAPLQVG
jgi:hypothetical protein